MIERVIRASVENRVLVLFGALLLAIAGIVAVLKTPVDALPDLSDVQVIIKTDYSGQAPEIVENEVTYPISTTMLSVPGASTVRGFSLFGTSFVYVLFEDGTDLYWARSRVLESLNSAAGKLPSGVTPELGPDATGVGWIYQYALVDKSGKNDLESLRALQDWFLKYELKTIPGVAEVASVGRRREGISDHSGSSEARAVRRYGGRHQDGAFRFESGSGRRLHRDGRKRIHGARSGLPEDA